jgi:hypothetical protein|tara:strand:- start:4931 stop:5329 length:399 start_codon:yes stop_codon:yes gene_type:complete
MHPFIKSGLAVLAGIFVGGIVNFGIIILSSSIIPPPNGVDVSNIESIKTNIHLYKPIHFLFPFLAHALGTFSGAVLAIKISKQTKIAYMVALVFLYGGISMITQVPSPMWFTVLDLGLAYIPMAWLATKISS